MQTASTLSKHEHDASSGPDKNRPVRGFNVTVVVSGLTVGF